ncbi:MAG: hypothetical protein AB1714_03160 [Acidobacteriota bacterium]
MRSQPSTTGGDAATHRRRLGLASAVFAALLAVHAIFSAWAVGGLCYRRLRFINWWLHADLETHEQYLYKPEYADLTRRCLSVIPSGDRVLVRTDGFPWLLNYYLYPIALYQETTTPPANQRVFLPSPRQAAYPARTDIGAEWIIEDHSEGAGRSQRLIRVSPESPPR